MFSIILTVLLLTAALAHGQRDGGTVLRNFQVRPHPVA